MSEIPTVPVGNYLFFPFIRALHLEISSLDLKEQVLDSSFIPTYINPEGARSNLKWKHVWRHVLF